MRKLIDPDKYIEALEHFRDKICYMRNVSLTDCCEVLRQQPRVEAYTKEEVEELLSELESDIRKNLLIDSIGLHIIIQKKIDSLEDVSNE